jgi:hypothetical protein
MKRLIAGQKFGKLLVLSDNLVGPKRQHILVRCECGREFEVYKSNIISGKSQSCGKGICQSHFVDISNQKFGSLLVKEPIESNDDHGLIWKCLCECGKEYNVRGSALRNGHTKSCGCKTGEFISESLSKENGVSNLNQLYNTYKNQARLRGYEWLINIDDFALLTKQDCYYCGAAPKQEIIKSNISGDRILLYNGLDRLDNDKDYLIDNVVTACGVCNIAKREMSFTDFTGWIFRVANHLSGRKIK